MILTTDFFTPVVDDAYDYGAIAAANSLSDIYAMGGKPFLALNITAFPPDLDIHTQQSILRGAAEKAREAGVVIAGGHTIRDKEPKFGLVVLGQIKIKNLLTKIAAHPGDHLILTKPLGFGVTTTALKQEKSKAEDVIEAVTWMKLLNSQASQLACEFNLQSGTDITGYGLLGHGWEICQASQVGLQIDFNRVPVLAGARKYAQEGCFSGGAYDNRLFYGSHVGFSNAVDEVSQMLLFDPQTSGGLLLCVPENLLPPFILRAHDMGLSIWEIGHVVPGHSIEVF